MNHQSQPLQLFEAEAICADSKASNRLLQSYRLMLDFYGLQLIDSETGEVFRCKRWRAGLGNLADSSHNWLRVTRILKCLGEFGLEHYKKPLLEHLIKEMWFGILRVCFRSMRDYWIPVVKSESERDSLLLQLKQPPKTKIGQKRPGKPVSVRDEKKRTEAASSSGPAMGKYPKLVNPKKITSQDRKRTGSETTTIKPAELIERNDDGGVRETAEEKKAQLEAMIALGQLKAGHSV
jgi:hypothetical protein